MSKARNKVKRETKKIPGVKDSVTIPLERYNRLVSDLAFFQNHFRLIREAYDAMLKHFTGSEETYRPPENFNQTK